MHSHSPADAASKWHGRGPRRASLGSPTLDGSWSPSIRSCRQGGETARTVLAFHMPAASHLVGSS